MPGSSGSELDLLTGGQTCPVCGQESALVTPDCVDGHGADCPDRLCVACGVAVFLDPVLVTPAHRSA